MKIKNYLIYFAPAITIDILNLFLGDYGMSTEHTYFNFFKIWLTFFLLFFPLAKVTADSSSINGKVIFIDVYDRFFAHGIFIFGFFSSFILTYALLFKAKLFGPNPLHLYQFYIFTDINIALAMISSAVYFSFFMLLSLFYRLVLWIMNVKNVPFFLTLFINSKKKVKSRIQYALYNILMSLFCSFFSLASASLYLNYSPLRVDLIKKLLIFMADPRGKYFSFFTNNWIIYVFIFFAMLYAFQYFLVGLSFYIKIQNKIISLILGIFMFFSYYSILNLKDHNLSKLQSLIETAPTAQELVEQIKDEKKQNMQIEDPFERHKFFANYKSTFICVLSILMTLFGVFPLLYLTRNYKWISGLFSMSYFLTVFYILKLDYNIYYNLYIFLGLVAFAIGVAGYRYFIKIFGLTDLEVKITSGLLLTQLMGHAYLNKPVDRDSNKY